MTNTKFTDFFINIKRMSSNYWKKAKTTILVLSKNPNKIEKKMYLLISVREIRKHHQEDVEKDQESSRWKKIWRAIARKAKRKKNWSKSKKRKRNYHTFMTTQKRHHFFSFYDMYFYRHNCRAETIFFSHFPAHRCTTLWWNFRLSANFSANQNTYSIAKLCYHWLKCWKKDEIYNGASESKQMAKCRQRSAIYGSIS